MSAVIPDLVGTTWRINDSLTRFVVVNVLGPYAYVENLQGHPRRRRILTGSLKTTKSKHGYTQLCTVGDEATS